MGYRLLTTVILSAHFAYLGYVILGGFLAWRWPRAIWVHGLAAGWALAIAFHWVQCPLTYAENWSREQAGQTRPKAAFVDRYIEGVLYPERFTVLLQVLVGLVILGSWVGFAVRRRRARADTARKSEDSSGRAATV